MSLANRVRAELVPFIAIVYRDLEQKELSGDRNLAAEIEALPWTVDRPPHHTNAVLATSVAMILAAPLRKSPKEIGERIAKAINGSYSTLRAEVAGPGFVNLTLPDETYHAELKEIIAAGPAWGRAPAGSGQRVNVEFVSANPTGPVSVASGRNAIIGDTLVRIFEARGHRVTREYYVNDRGNQVRKLLDSVKKVAKLVSASKFAETHMGKVREALRQRTLELMAKEDIEYRGEYLIDLAEWFIDHGRDFFTLPDDKQARMVAYRLVNGIPGSKILPGIRPSLATLGVNFDVWFSEESLHTSGLFDQTMRELIEEGKVEDQDRTLVYSAPGLQDGKRISRKSDGEWTYFASDTAYCADKIARGYDRLVIVIGADHHGYVPWLEDALKTLGFKGRFDGLLYQLIMVVKHNDPNGQYPKMSATEKMSKRAGNIVTIDEMMNEIDEAHGRKGAGADALRMIFLMRSSNTAFDFDVNQAKSQSMDNPVFYVQYAYARLCSIQRRARHLGFEIERDLNFDMGSFLEWEQPLIHRLGEFPEIVEKAATLLEPHRVAAYVYDLAREFHSYYSETRNDPILPHEATIAKEDWQQEWNRLRTGVRLAFIEATRTVFSSALGLLGVTATPVMEKHG